MFFLLIRKLLTHKLLDKNAIGAHITAFEEMVRTVPLELGLTAPQQEEQRMQVENRRHLAAMRALRLKGKERGLFTIGVERWMATEKSLQAWQAWVQKVRLKREAAEELRASIKRREVEVEAEAEFEFDVDPDTWRDPRLGP